MLESRNKISLRQILFIFMIVAFSPAIRFTPAYAADKAKQAAWLTALPAVLPLLIIVFIFSKVFIRYKEKNLFDVFYDIFGIYIGKFIVFLYFLWSFWLTVMYLRYDAERLVSTTYPNIEINFFAVITILLIAYILPKGITVIGRISEIFFPLILITFVLLFLFLLPNVRLDSLIPVSSKDFIPVLQGSFAATDIGLYMVLLFFLSEFINDKEKLPKYGTVTIISYVLLTTMLIFITVGSLTSSVVKRMSIPFLVAVKQISVWDIFEKIESLVVGAWIYADFILLATFSFITLNILKSLLKLKDTKYYLNIFLVLVYLIAMGLAVNRFELAAFSKKIMNTINIIYGFIIPVMLFTVGKIRGKL